MSMKTSKSCYLDLSEKGFWKVSDISFFGIVKGNVWEFVWNWVEAKKIWNRVDGQCSEHRSKTHKRLKRTLWGGGGGQNRAKRANFWGSSLFRATYNVKTEKQTIDSLCFCQLDAWRLAEGKNSQAQSIMAQPAKMAVATSGRVVCELISQIGSPTMPGQHSQPTPTSLGPERRCV